MYHWGKEAPEGCPRAGALTIPRELSLVNDRVFAYPVAVDRHLLKAASDHVRVVGESLEILDDKGTVFSYPIPPVRSIEILEDAKAAEVFINHGEVSVTQWFI